METRWPLRDVPFHAALLPSALHPANDILHRPISSSSTSISCVIALEKRLTDTILVSRDGTIDVVGVIRRGLVGAEVVLMLRVDGER